MPCDWWFVLLLLLLLLIVAILLLEKRCISLDSALGPVARCSCAVKEAVPPFIPEVDRK